MKSLNYFYLPIILVWFIHSSVSFAQGNWTNMNASPMPLISAVVAYIGDDKVVLFGGYDGITEGLDQTWVYDLSDNTWTLKNPAVKPPGRYAQGMAYIGGDKILMTGGSYGGINIPAYYYTDTWVYDLSDNTWINKTPSPIAPMASILAMDYAGGDKVVQVRDGYTWIFDLSDNAWTLANTAGPNAYTGDQVSYIGGDKIFVHSFNGPVETYIYDVSDNAWTTHTPLNPPNPRFNVVTAYLGGDRVLYCGGLDVFAGGLWVDDTWIYDLSDDAWTMVTPSTSPGVRFVTTMDRIGVGQALLTGGWGEAGYLLPDTWLFTASGSPCGQEVCDNGKVLVCHINSGNSSPTTLCVAPSAVQAHLNHGDSLGACDCGGSGSQYSAAPPPNNFEQDIDQFAEVHQDDFNDQPISVFPNPADESVEIHAPPVQQVQIRLTDSSGKILQTLIGQNEKFQFETSSLFNGIYFIQILSAESTITRPLVILH